MQYFLLAAVMIPMQAFAQGQYSVSQQLTQAVSVTSTSYVAANRARKYLRIRNLDSSIIVYVKIGTAHSAIEGVRLAAGEIWEPRVVPAGAIFVKSASGTPNVEIVEGI
jgi:hypothetical protein